MHLSLEVSHGALGQKAKHWAQIGHRPLFPGLDAQSLTVFELAGLHPLFKRSGISSRPLAPYPCHSSSSLVRWAQAEEAEWIGEGQEVSVGEIVTATRKEKTKSGLAGAVVGELEHWTATFPAHFSLTGP